jgi:hypothetical protein
MKLRTGDILFEKDNNFVDKGIQLFTNSPYSHVAMVYDAEENLIIQSHLGAGVHITSIDSLNEFYMLRIEQLYFYHTEKEIKKAARKYLGRKYDLWQIPGFIVSSVLRGENYFNSPHKVLCTELIDLIYYDLGFNLVHNKFLGDISPGELYKELYKIIKGDVKYGFKRNVN